MRNKKPKKHSDILIGRLREYIIGLDGLKEIMQKDYDFNTKTMNGLKESMLEDIEALKDSQKRKRFKQRMTTVKQRVEKELLH